MQQNRAPRPLPLFLELVRLLSTEEPESAAKALDGLRKYEQAPRVRVGPERPIVSKIGPASLRDCGGSGPAVVLVPSLINPPDVLDLDEDVSLGAAVAKMGRHALLLDWGEARGRQSLDLGGHIEKLLVPLLKELGEPPALIGYCLGGTMAIAAANLAAAERVATLAAPWSFSAYPDEARRSLLRLWTTSKALAEPLGVLPMEVLQSAFWSLDPKRTVTKFARFAEAQAESGAARRFVTLEDWANEGEPLPYPAARQLIEDLFGAGLPGKGEWRVADQVMDDELACPILNITASDDRITPAPTAPDGPTVKINAGHVGMVVGSARAKLHKTLDEFLMA